MMDKTTGNQPGPSARLAAWRADRTLAHVAPLVVFMLFLMLPGLVQHKHPDVPWWKYAPEHWIYPAQTLACGALLVWWWRAYRFTRPSPGALIFGVVGGLVGIAVWILPCEIFHRGGFTEESAGWLKHLGVQPRLEGFDPEVFPAPWLAVGMRFLRMVVVVALVEEIFWRGFLMRWLVNPDGNPWKVPFGTHHWRALLGTLVGVVLVHQPADYAASAVWALLLYGLAVRTKSLVSCVVAHGVANLVLGIYALQSGHHGFW